MQYVAVLAVFCANLNIPVDYFQCHTNSDFLTSSSFSNFKFVFVWYTCDIGLHVCMYVIDIWGSKRNLSLNLLWGIDIAIVKYLNRRQMLLYWVNYCLYVCLFSAIYICNICNLGWYNMSSLYWLIIWLNIIVAKYIMYKAAYVCKHDNVTYIVCSEKAETL